MSMYECVCYIYITTVRTMQHRAGIWLSDAVRQGTGEDALRDDDYDDDDRDEDDDRDDDDSDDGDDDDDGIEATQTDRS